MSHDVLHGVFDVGAHALHDETGIGAWIAIDPGGTFT